MLAEWEPFFSFQAGIAPHQLHQLTVAQIAGHIDYWNRANAGGDHA